MNEPVDPVTPEVACSSLKAAPEIQSPGMSDMVENFIQLAQSLQRRGIGSGDCHGSMSELQSQLRKHSSHATESYVGLHGRRKSPQRPRTPQDPAVSDVMHIRPQTGSPALDAAREEARQMLQTLLSQAAAGLQRDLSSKSGRLKSTSSPKKPSCDHESSHQHCKPGNDASTATLQGYRGLHATAETSTAEFQRGKKRWQMPAVLQTHANTGEPSHATQSHPPDSPILAELYTPFSPVASQTVTTCRASGNFTERSRVRHRPQEHALQMLDVTRTSIAKDKDRKLGAGAVTQNVHVEQGRQYLGVATWHSSPQRRPANVDLLHGYRSQCGRPGEGDSSYHSMPPAKWVPGGRNKQTFNKFAAEQSQVGVSQKTSTGYAAAAYLRCSTHSSRMACSNSGQPVTRMYGGCKACTLN